MKRDNKSKEEKQKELEISDIGYDASKRDLTGNSYTCKKFLEEIMRFFRNRDNKDYLMIKLTEYLEYVFTCGQPEVGENMQAKIMMTVLSSSNFQLDAPVAIKKESSLGKFLLNHIDNVNIIDEDKIITQEKIQNALLIALYDNKDYKLSNKLGNMFREGITGTIANLELQGYSRTILDIIGQTENIDIHIKKRTNNYRLKEVILFDEGNLLYTNLVNGDYQYKKQYNYNK